jgi:hypothetical protein
LRHRAFFSLFSHLFFPNSSFAAFQARSRAPQLEERLLLAQSSLSSLSFSLSSSSLGPAARLAASLRARLASLAEQLEEAVLQPVFALPFLQPGRLLRLAAPDPAAPHAWAALVNVTRQV